MAQNVIDIQKIGKTYRIGTQEVNALLCVDLQINKGEYVALMGPSGSGKSTLMNILGCLDTPSRGSYKLNGTDVHVSTAQAFSGVKKRGDSSSSLIELIHLPMNDWKNVVQNDFEESVFKIYPELANIKSKLYDLGAEYAAMSGSGSTILGLFKVLPDLSEMKKNYTVFSCEL